MCSSDLMAKRAPRLQFTEEERASPELAPAIQKADKQIKKLEKAEAKVPKKEVKQRVVDSNGKITTRLSFEEKKPYLDVFVGKIDNWSVCDSTCSGMKPQSGENVEAFFAYAVCLAKDRREFVARFGIVMLLDHFITDTYIDEVLQVLDEVSHDGYYVKMAVAWAISICYVKFEEKTMVLLRENTLDDFTYNKSLQKITESYRVTKEDKARIRSMKRVTKK